MQQESFTLCWRIVSHRVTGEPYIVLQESLTSCYRRALHRVTEQSFPLYEAAALYTAEGKALFYTGWLNKLFSKT